MPAAPPRYVLATAGSTGDMHPFMALARALQALGRRVDIVGPAAHADLVAPTGLPFTGLGTHEEYERVIANPDLWHPRRGFKVMFGRYQAVLLEGFHAFMAFQGSAPLVVIGHPLALPAAALAREKGSGARLVGTWLAPSNLRSRHGPLQLGPVAVPRWVPPPVRGALWRLLDRALVDPHAATALAAARAELGLPALGQSFLPHMQALPELSLALFPDWFAPPQPDWPRPLLQGDFPLYDAGADAPTPPPLAAFLEAGSPPLVVTPGTGNTHAGRLFDAALRAAQCLRRRAVFLTRHRTQVPATLPDTVLWLPYVPLARLLPHAAALVHHGGIGTTAEALRAGVPQLVTPFAWDQFDNAARVRALGVGAVLPAASIGAARLQRRLQALLSSADTPRRCAQVAARFPQRPRLQALCRALETALGLAAP
ncbi:nucleotide disphospho-sugar-binding domain-containing protein [Azohydromonas aeria]|uniref:nucleotide disphospho-sugar-binding domain-containing protein n=1 Tax=Azohydromonas aeria TaxID=2590212 RepID=UPI0018E0043A|nr:nucleotide disphospho-sugar-binding domain-containing protein [Azohydromonas aeria]